MNRDEALRRLRANEFAFRAKGAGALYLFGSTARDEAGPTSDLDLLVDPACQETFDLFDLIELRDEIADRLAVNIDIIVDSTRRNRFRTVIEPDLLRVF